MTTAAERALPISFLPHDAYATHRHSAVYAMARCRAAEQITATQSKPCGSICGQSAVKDLDDPMESQRSVPSIPGYGKNCDFRHVSSYLRKAAR